MGFDEKQRLEAPVVSGVTVDRDVIKVALEGLPARADTISEVFQLIASAGVNVDIIVHDKLVNSDQLKIGFTMNQSELDRISGQFDIWRKREGFANLKVFTEGRLAKVSTVGLGMQSHPGVASKMFSVLTEMGIEIHMVSTSEIKISCVIPEDCADKAAQSLHKAFI